MREMVARRESVPWFVSGSFNAPEHVDILLKCIDVSTQLSGTSAVSCRDWGRCEGSGVSSAPRVLVPRAPDLGNCEVPVCSVSADVKATGICLASLERWASSDPRWHAGLRSC